MLEILPGEFFFVFFAPCFQRQNFYPANFCPVLMITIIEPMTIFTAWAKIKYLWNARVAGLGKIFAEQFFFFFYCMNNYYALLSPRLIWTKQKNLECVEGKALLVHDPLHYVLVL